jgi:alkaline phosphatase
MRPVILLVALAACSHAVSNSPPDAGAVDAGAPDTTTPGVAPAVIILIGDGMGPGQLAAASGYAHGAPGMLAMQALPVQGQVRTGGPSGITDSAAAATVMATGVYTYNGNIGVDRAEQPVESIVERAHARGWATGVVTTSSLPHATPAGFTAHVDSRAELQAIADQQVMETRADVMLGGGSQYFTAHGDDLAAAGYQVVGTAAELATAAATATRLFGTFAPDHMTYVEERPADTTEPMLADMAAAALDVLDRDPDGFFLMIEGARIDMASHGNHLVDAIQQTIAFDATVAAVAAWAAARGNTTVIVTADHECGGLEIVSAAGAGEYPQVAWRWGAHTNARVSIFADGPGTEVLDGALVDHRWVYEIARARVDGDTFREPGRTPIPDGELGDLRHRAAVQTVATGFGVGSNQLDALWVDATADGLFVGVEGVFEWHANAVELWLDADPGAGTGPGGLADSLSDATGAADGVLRASKIGPPALPGFGVDLAVISVGGSDPHVEDLQDDGGLRGVRAPYGAPADLGWHGAAINFGSVRTTGVAIAPVAGQGMEVFVPWAALYPAGRPAGARVGVAAVLVNSDGGYSSNQALPPFPAGTPNPGRTVTALPGVVLYDVDHDGDGVVDGDQPPVVTGS